MAAATVGCQSVRLVLVKQFELHICQPGLWMPEDAAILVA